MSAPWEQSSGFGVNTLSNPYDRMMNTSGIGLRDHAGSMVRRWSLDQNSVLSISVELTQCFAGDRTSVVRLCNSPATHWFLVGTSSVNSTKDPRTETWKNDYADFLPRFTEKSLSPLGR